MCKLIFYKDYGSNNLKLHIVRGDRGRGVREGIQGSEQARQQGVRGEGNRSEKVSNQQKIRRMHRPRN